MHKYRTIIIHSTLHLGQQNTEVHNKTEVSENEYLPYSGVYPMLSHTPSHSDLARADVTQGAQMKQEVVVREGCFRVRYATVVTLTTKHITGSDLSMS